MQWDSTMQQSSIWHRGVKIYNFLLKHLRAIEVIFDETPRCNQKLKNKKNLVTLYIPLVALRCQSQVKYYKRYESQISCSSSIGNTFRHEKLKNVHIYSMKTTYIWVLKFTQNAKFCSDKMSLLKVLLQILLILLILA